MFDADARPVSGGSASPARVMLPHPPSAHDALARIGEQSAKRTQEALVSDLVAIAYPNLETAREVAQNVGQAQKAHLIELDDMVIAEHRQDGKLKLHQPSPRGRRRRRRRAVGRPDRPDLLRPAVRHGDRRGEAARRPAR